MRNSIPRGSQGGTLTPHQRVGSLPGRVPQAGPGSPMSVASSCGSDSRRTEARSIRTSERMSLKKNSDSHIRMEGDIASQKQRTYSMWMVLWKVLQTLIVLLSGVLVGLLVITGSVDWIYSSSTSTWPILSCPSQPEVLGLQGSVDGSSCMIRFSFNDFGNFEKSMTNAFSVSGADCYLKTQYTSCSSSALCRVRCFSVGSSCADAVGSGSCSDPGVNWGDEYSDLAVGSSCTQSVRLARDSPTGSFVVRGSSISAQPMCGSNENLSASMVVLIRGILLGILCIGLLVSVSLIIKAKVAPPSTTIQQRSVGKPAPSSTTSSSSPTASAKLFASTSWKYRVRVMHAMLRKRREQARMSVAKWTLATILLVLALVAGSVLLILTQLPASFPNNLVVGATSASSNPNWGLATATWSLTSPLYSSRRTYIPGTWIDGVMVGDVCVNFLVVLLGSLFGLRWSPCLSEKEKSRLSQLGASEEAALVVLLSSRGGRNKARLEKFVDAAVNRLKFGAVILVELGMTSSPPSESTSGGLVPDSSANASTPILYVYLPDSRKQLALHWVSQVWLPFLHRNNRIPTLFKHIVSVDYENVSPSLTVSGIHPGTLNQIIMTADSSEWTNVLLPAQVDDWVGGNTPRQKTAGSMSWVAGWENMRLQHTFFRRIFETQLTAAGSSGSGGGLVTSIAPSEFITVWDRRTALDIGYSSAGASQRALLVARQRGKAGFATSSSCPPLHVRNSIYHLYREQSNSCVNFLSQIRELAFSLSSFTHWGSWGLKVLLLLGPLMETTVLVARPLIFGSLMFRDPICAAILLGAAWTVSVMTNFIHKFNSRNIDKNAFPTIYGSVFTYPLYQLYMGCMHVGLALGEGCSFGSMKDDAVRPSEPPVLGVTNANTAEVFPCPPHPDVDWLTVWRTSDHLRPFNQNDGTISETTFVSAPPSIV